MSSCTLAVNSGFLVLLLFIISNIGYETTPLQVARVPHLVGRNILHVREVDRCCHSS